MRKAWIVVVAVLSLGVCGAAAFAADEKPAPAYLSLKVANLDAPGQVTLKDVLTKEKNLLVFFQTACSACRGELSFLRDNYSNSPKVNIVGISVDFRPDLVRKYKEEYRIPFVFLSDPDYTVPVAFKVTSTPAAILLDKDGNVIERYLGFSADSKALFEAALK